MDFDKENARMLQLTIREYQAAKLISDLVHDSQTTNSAMVIVATETEQRYATLVAMAVTEIAEQALKNCEESNNVEA